MGSGTKESGTQTSSTRIDQESERQDVNQSPRRKDKIPGTGRRQRRNGESKSSRLHDLWSIPSGPVPSTIPRGVSHSSPRVGELRTTLD